MGAVHGVYLKYVGLSAVSWMGNLYLTKDDFTNSTSIINSRSLLSTSCSGETFWRKVFVWGLAYSGLVNGGIALGFFLHRGMKLIGKNSKTGYIPLWSYLLYWPFYIPTTLYTFLHTLIGIYLPSHQVPVVSQVLPGMSLHE